MNDYYVLVWEDSDSLICRRFSFQKEVEDYVNSLGKDKTEIDRYPFLYKIFYGEEFGLEEYEKVVSYKLVKI